MPNRWKPNVTVAALIEREGRFLLVEEETTDGLKLNNPAGHLDPGESPMQACAREVLEETARRITIIVEAVEAVEVGTMIAGAIVMPVVVQDALEEDEILVLNPRLVEDPLSPHQNDELFF